MIQLEDLKLLKSRFKSGKVYRDREYRKQWMDLRDYQAPKLGRFTEYRKKRPAEGESTRDREKIINSEHIRSRKIAAAGMKGGLTPHSLPWIKLGLFDRDLEAWEPAREWLSRSTSLLLAAFNGSNLYAALMNVYHEELVFATGAMKCLKHEDRIFHFRPWTIGTYVVTVDAFGDIDGVFREYYETLRNLVTKYGLRKLSLARQARFKTHPDDYVLCVKAIFPRSDAQRMNLIGPKSWSYGVVVWEDSCEEQNYLYESGFLERPFMIPRWDNVEEDPYGSDCPGMELQGDVKMLQKLELEKLLMLEKRNAPPMNVPHGFKGTLDLDRYGVNILPNAGTQKIEPTFDYRHGVEDLRQEIRDVEQRIGRGYFNDLFLMFIGEDKNMTATEVIRRHEEKLALLGPVVERQNSDLLVPLVARSFAIMVRAGKIPPPPKELLNADLRVEFISLLEQAQRAVGTNSIERGLDFIGRIAEMQANTTKGYPEILDKVMFDETFDQYADMVGMDPRLIRSAEEAGKLRKDRQQAQAQMQQEASIAQGAQVAQSLNQIEIDPAKKTALTEAIARAGGRA